MGRKVRTKYSYELADGAKVTHIESYVTDSEALFDELDEKIKWRQFKYKVYDRNVLSPRLMHIINFEKTDLESLPELNKIKSRLEKLLKIKFNYAVLNYYRDGSDYISYHSDNEVSMGQKVASVSVGTTRRFLLKHKWRDGVKHEFVLADGDVLILNDAAIRFAYKHSVPKTVHSGQRINITFRE